MGRTVGRAILEGDTHAGVPIELHETELAPGQMPHPPHHHVHEEMILVREGTMEVTIAGKSAKLGPGSVGFVRQAKNMAGATSVRTAHGTLCWPWGGRSSQRTVIMESPVECLGASPDTYLCGRTATD